MIQQLFAISRNAFQESIRQSVFLVLLLVSLLLVTGLLMLPGFTMDDDNLFLVEMGLSTVLFAGIALAAVSAATVVCNELENQTALTVISKPVARPVFVLAKFLGVAAAVVLGFWILAATFLMVVRFGALQNASDKIDWPSVLFFLTALLTATSLAALGNYLYRWNFASTMSLVLAVTLALALLLVLLVNKKWQLQGLGTEFRDAGAAREQHLLALLMIFLATLIASAVSIAAATRLSLMMTLLVCLGYFALLALVNGYVLAPYRDSSLLAKACYRLLPSLEYFWPGDALTQGHPITRGYVGLLASYSLLHVTALLALAVGLFQNRELN